jgi:hypothetical protein
MALDPTEVAVAGTGHLYRAPVGTAFPADAEVAIDLDDWVELGYSTPEGVRFNFGRETSEVMAWQSLDALRVLTTSTPREIAVDFLQFNQANWALAMGGGEWTEGSPGLYSYEPPEGSDVDEFAYIVEAIDGDEVYRWCFRRVTNMGGVEFSLTRENAIILPITVKVLAAPAGAKPFVFLTNDAALGEALAS